MTRLTIAGGDGSDLFTLKNLWTLNAFSLAGGSGDDSLRVENLM